MKDAEGLRLGLREQTGGIPIPIGVQIRYTVTLPIKMGKYSKWIRYNIRYKPLQRVFQRKKALT
jgi:hypothetical protein